MRKTKKTIALVLSLLMVVGNIGLFSGLFANDLFGTKQTADARAAGSYYIKVRVHDTDAWNKDSCNNSSGYLVVPTRTQDGSTGTLWSNYVAGGAWDTDGGTWEYTGNNPVNGFPTQLRKVQTCSADATNWMKNNNSYRNSIINFKIFVSKNGSDWTEVLSYDEETSNGGNWSYTNSVDSSKYPYPVDGWSISGATSVVTSGSTTQTYSVNNAYDQYGVAWGTDSLSWTSSHSAATINSSGVATFGNNDGRDYDVTFSTTLGNYTKSITVHVYTSGSITYNLNGGTASGNPTGYNIETAPVRLNAPTRFGYTFTGWTGSNGTSPSTDVYVPNVITSGLSSYTKSNPYTADGRDHVFGNAFTVVPGVTYRVYVTAKRTAGSLNMNGGIWYSAGQTSGNAWDGVGGSFTYLKDAGDGWGVYYKDVTVPAGKQKGQFYVQLEQYSPYGAVWQLADCFVTAPFTSYPLGLDGYTVSNPYTCDGRDHVIGNVFDVTPGKTYRVVVTAKRTAGSLDMQGGIWYNAGQTSGNAWDGVGGAFTYLGDAGNGWGTYYKDVTVPTGKQKGQFYIQMEQYSPYGTVWQIANMAVVDRAQKTALSYTANWSPVNYTISYTLNGGSASGNPTGYNIETSPVKLNNPTRTGYIFNGWTGSNGAVPSTDVDAPNVVSSGISYTTASPYTAGSRDHKLGNSFTVLPGMVYRVFVTAKRTAGSLNLQGGIWYTSQTSGASYDGYGGEFTYLKDAGNGWGVYYKDVTVPVGKQKGQCYYQLNQYDSDANKTTWQLANCYVTARFNAVPLGLQQYTTSNPYTCSVRDYVIGDAFDVEVGKTYRVYVTAKRTSGSLTLNGGIAYSAGYTSGAWYDGVGGAFTLESDLGDGWGRYYKDVTVPAGKQKGQFYAQIDQWADTATTTWLIADMAIADQSLRNLSYTANWTPVTYTVDYNGNGYTGGSTASSTHTYDAAKALTVNGYSQVYTVTYNAMGGSVSATAANTAANSAFAGWATSADGSAVYSDGQNVTNLSGINNATVTLYAKWTPGSVTLPTPARNGYTFGGWYTDEACTDANKVTGSSYTPGTNRTLYAKWTADPYTISFDAAGGEAIDPLHYKITDSATIPATTRSGYRFDGWEVTAASGAWTANASVASGDSVNGKYGSPTLTARWTPVEYTVILDVDGVQTVDTYTIESTGSLPEESKTGYDFQGWQVTVGAGNWTETANLAAGTALAGRYGDVTLNAQWKAKTYGISYTLGEGAATENAPLSVDYDGIYSFTVTLDESHNQTTPNITAANATVTQTRTGDVIAVTLSNVTGAVAVNVPTDVNTYSLIVNGDEGFTVNDSVTTATYGSSFRFTVTLKEGYTQTAPTVTKGGETLTAKTVSGNAYTYEIENVTADATVSVATAKNTYAVTFTADDGADAPAAQTVSHGANCSFTVTLKEGYTQKAPTVTKDGETLTPKTVSGNAYAYEIENVTADVSVSITTAKNTYAVTFTADDGADAPAAQTVSHGADCSFTVTLKEGYTQNAPTVTVNGTGLTASGVVGGTYSYVIGNVQETKAVEIATTLNKYRVTFVDEDGTVLKAAVAYDYGTPAADIERPADPVKPATQQYTYTFAGWDQPIAAVTEDVTYAAVYTSAVNKYRVTFADEDGTVLKAAVAYDYGTPAADIERPADPVKPATQQYTYTFAGWDQPIAAVTEDVTYAAVYTSAVNKYRVTFADEDGTVLKAAVAYDYGTPAADIERPADPVKPADAQYTYTFRGWEPEVATVTDAASYVARYDGTLNSYTVKFVNGETVLQEETLDYGTTPSYKGDEPSMEATAEFTYSFTGWDKPIASVTGAETYTAMFSNITNSYEVKFVNYDDSPLQTETLLYGVLPEYKGATPEKPADAQYTYTFNGWDKTIGLVTGEAVYKAAYTETVNTYTITWLDEDGVSVLDSQVLAFGVTPVYGGADPAKAYDAAQHYSFSGWDREIASVEGAADYTAVYTGEGHVWDGGTVSVVPTCAAVGRKDFACTVCGAAKEEVMDKDPDNHAGGTEVRGRIDPTEDEDGYSGDTYCRGCGEMLKQGKTLRNLTVHCEFCGKYHEGVLGAIITAIHGIIWLFHKAFRLGNPYDM